MRPTRRPTRRGATWPAAAAGAAILYGAAYPATAVALRSFTPLAIAGIACTIALPFVIARPPCGLVHAAAPGGLERGQPAPAGRSWPPSAGSRSSPRPTSRSSLSGSTVTGFVAPLYAVAAALLAVPILGERIRPVTAAAFALALVGTSLLAGVDPSAETLTGVALAAGAAVMFGLYIVLARRWGSATR